MLRRTLPGLAWDFVLPHVDLAPARIKRRHDLALSATSEDAHFQQRNRRDRLAQYFSRSLDYRKADAKAGERSWPRGHRESSDVVFVESLGGEQRSDARNTLGREGAAGQRHSLDHFYFAVSRPIPRSRQRDAAMLAGSIDGEKKHEKEFLAVSVIRGNPWPGFALFLNQFQQHAPRARR